MSDEEPYGWLLTVAQNDCRGFATIPTREHPADYVLKNHRYSLIFAMPLSRNQFLAFKKWYENG